MKRILLLILTTCLISTAFSQEEIWGYNTLAGSEGGGLIFTVDPETKTTTPIHRFGHGLRHQGYPANGKLFQHAGGLFYGILIDGSEYRLYTFDPSTENLEYLSIVPGDPRIVALDGNTVFFEIALDSTSSIISTYNIESQAIDIFDTITSEMGSDLQGYWLKADENTFYVLARTGGANNKGSIIKINLLQNEAKPIFHFSSSYYPEGSLLKHSNQRIYGALMRTTNKGLGGIFEFIPEQETIRMLANFNIETGSVPSGELFEYQDGSIFGVTSLLGDFNDGTIYKFNPLTNEIAVVYQINNESYEFLNHKIDGGFQQIGSDELMGIMVAKNDSASGKIFSLDLTTQTLDIIYNFHGKNITQPVGSLVPFDDGFLGLVQWDDINSSGGIFSYQPAIDTLIFVKTLFGHTITENGQNPDFLCQADNQQLYGLTAYGGRENKGIMFMIDMFTHRFIKLGDLADLDFDIIPFAAGFVLAPGKIIGISGPHNRPLNKYHIFEWDYCSNTLTILKTIEMQYNKVIYPPRLNSGGNLYFGGSNYFYEYDYQTDTLTETAINNIPIIGDILEYEEDKYIGYMDQGAPNYNMLFTWNRKTGEIQEMLSQINFGTPVKIWPNGILHLSGEKLYGSYSSASSSGGHSYAYAYDIIHDIFLSSRPLNGTFDNHITNSMLETRDKGYFIENINYGSPVKGYVEFYQKDEDSTYTLPLEHSDVVFYNSYMNGWSSRPRFDFKPIVDLLSVNPIKEGFYWIGEEDSDWHNPNNWYESKTPTELSDVVILPFRSNYPVIENHLKTGKIELHHQATLTLNPQASLTCRGISNNGHLKLLGNQNAKASIIVEEFPLNKKQITYTLDTENQPKMLVGSPLSGSNPNLYEAATFNGQHWQSLDDSLVSWAPFKAFLLTGDSTGEIVLGGEMNWGDYTFQDSTTTGSLAPLANPYPAYLNWETVNKQELNNRALYRIQPSDSSISVFMDGLGDASPLIEPTDAFWIYQNSGESFQLTNSDRIHPSEYAPVATPDNELTIKLQSNKTSHQTILSFDGESNKNFEGDKDALSPEFIQTNGIQVYTLAGAEKLMVNQLPDTAIMDLAVEAKTAGTYTLSIAHQTGFDFVVLEDLIWHKKIDLLKENYSFDYFTTDGAYPFKLYFEPWVLEPLNESDVEMYFYPESIVVNSRKQIERAEITLFDLAGRAVEQFNPQNFFRFEQPVNLPTGHYILQLRSGDFVLNKKILVRR